MEAIHNCQLISEEPPLILMVLLVQQTAIFTDPHIIVGPVRSSHCVQVQRVDVGLAIVAAMRYLHAHAIFPLYILQRTTLDTPSHEALHPWALRVAETGRYLLHGWWYRCLFKLMAVCFQPQEQIKRPGCAQPGGEYLNAAIGVNHHTQGSKLIHLSNSRYKRINCQTK